MSLKHGILNLGNTCGINALIQCISSSPILCKALHKSLQEYDQQFQYDKDRSAAYQLSQVLICLSKETVNPSAFISTLFTRLKEFITFGYQHDIVELWTLLIDHLHGEVGIPLPLNELVICHPKSPLNERIEASIQMYNEKKMSTLMNVVQGVQMSIIRCKCGFTQANIEVFTTLQLDIDGTQSFMSALQRCFEPEEMLDWTCDNCRERGKAQKFIHPSKWPPVLVTVLKRFRSLGTGVYEKISNPIDIPDQFEADGHKYILMGLGQHHGGYDGGHYTAVSKDAHGDWHLYDDAAVYTLGNQLRYDANNAYLLIWQQI